VLDAALEHDPPRSHTPEHGRRETASRSTQQVASLVRIHSSHEDEPETKDDG